MTSCSGNSLSEVSVEATADSNRSLPVALDLLFINDSALIPELTALSGPEWFAKKRQFMLNYQQQILLASLEVVPLSAMQAVSLPDGYKNAENVLMFVNYLAGDGQHVAELSNYKQLKIRLERERYQLLETSKE